MFFLEILTSYIVPVIYTSFVSLVLVLFLLFIFRIKDSNIRILFFFLPLIKPFIIISERINFSTIYSDYFTSFLGLRFPDPNNIINLFENFKKGSPILSNYNYIILFLISVSIILILIIRWINLYLFYRNLAYEDKVGRKEIPEIYNVIDSYVKKIKIKTPDVSLTHKGYYSPFVVGIKKSTLVLSPNLLEELNHSEKETLIQHELSHIRRNDNLIGWAALILRDLLFFNPFAYIAYYLIKTEQERDSDKLIVKYSGKLVKEIAKNILNIILKIRSVSSLKYTSEPIQSFHFLSFSSFSQMRLRNRINSILKTDSSKIYSRIFPKILMFILFLTILIIQIMFVVKINNFYIFLR